LDALLEFRKLENLGFSFNLEIIRNCKFRKLVCSQKTRFKTEKVSISASQCNFRSGFEINLIKKKSNSVVMSNLKKTISVILIATFLVSIPLTLLNAKADIVEVVFTVEYDESYGKPVDGPPGLAKPPKNDDGDNYKIWFNRYTLSYVPMDMVVYTDNPDSLTAEFVFSAVSDAADAWDTATADTIVKTKTSTSGTASVVRNDENAVLFGDYPTDGVIAVATVWIDRRSKQLLECDIMFDTDFTWGDADYNGDGTVDNANVMDLQNIATHELGHCFNLADIYDSSLSYLTMYGYSGYGDIQKRTLADGDIAGIQSLFGAA
jgi:hypothetical protein